MASKQDIEISVVIPCRNEEANAVAIAAAVIAEVTKESDSYEIIFIDNGSSDRTVELVKGLCAENPRIRLIVNNRNYGQLRSPTHAIYQTRGRAVIGICADFQDPPAMLGEFIRRWRAGAQIVMAVRASEKSDPMTRLIRFMGYRMLNFLADYPIIAGATGFGLYERVVVDQLASWREPEPFFRGMLVESGYRVETIPYERPPRAGGATNNNFFTLADFALSALAGSSKKLLRMPFFFGLFLFASFSLTLLAALVWLALGHMVWLLLGFATTQFVFAWLFIFLALIGDQVRLISERTRNVPLVVEEERVNF